MIQARIGLRVLILSFYYRPDLSAGSFRTTAFVEALKAAIGPNDRIEVVTTLPNRYHSFAPEAPEDEIEGAVHIRRIRVLGHHSGMIDQALAFGRFSIQAMRYVDQRSFDVVFATSSRLFTAFLGAMCARRAGAKLYLDIRDIFNDTIKDVVRPPVARVLMPLLQRIERHTLRSARRVNLVSEGFRDYFLTSYPDKRYSFFTNGVDEEFIGIDFRNTPRADGKRVILYAGNIGEGQGLHRIVPQMAKILGPTYEFWIVGDGGRKQALAEAIEREHVDNVKLLPPVVRQELIDLYRDSDYLFLHLNDHDAFRKVLPSKIFEYASTGKPVLAGVAGHAAEFLHKHVEDSAVFRPCDAEAGVKALASLRIGYRRRDDFISRFRGVSIMKKLAFDVLGLVHSPDEA